jgi:hypothetical protein
VLGVDILEQSDCFILSEVGKDNVLFQKKISFKELLRDKWNELLEISSTKRFIQELKNNYTNEINLKRELENVFNAMEGNKKQLNGNWISIDEYSDLNYDSNFGNWVEASPIQGHLKFLLDLNSAEKKNCKINIPVMSAYGKGEFSVIYGAFQLSKNQILIWQNAIFPLQIKYALKADMLTLQIFEKEINFKRA